MDTTTLGDRMKMYEAAETSRQFTPLLPIYARLDGRCFSSFTKGMERPFDRRMNFLMEETTKHLVDETQAACGYTQSDEISLCWHSDDIKSQIFFDGKVQKMCSVLAGIASAKFAELCLTMPDEFIREKWSNKIPVFDCRIFPLPNRMECANQFVWRSIDAVRNSISMAAHHYYSPKQLHKKDIKEQQEMLFKKGVNWNDYPARFKEGVFYQRRKVLRTLSKDELARIPEQHRPKGPIERSDVMRLEVRKFSALENKSEFIFEGAEAIPQPKDNK